MFKLKSKSLIDYYGETPIDYNICFIHYGIDILEDSKEEYNLILEDLINIKNNVPKEIYKIYFSTLEDLKKITNNTNILDKLIDDIYVRIRNNNDILELNKIINNKSIKIIIDYYLIDNITFTDNLDIIIQVDTIKELPYNKLLQLNKKYNINKVSLGQIMYLNSYFKEYLERCANYLNIKINNKYDYAKVEKEIVLSNDIYNIDEYGKIEKELKSIVKDCDKTDLFEVYNRIIKKIKYDFEGIKDNKLNNQNLIGGLLNNTCVCEGYCKIVCQALSLLDIRSIVIGGGGQKEDGGHLWNQVEINGKWYNVDATSDSINLQRGKKIEYFLVKKSIFESDYIIQNECEEDYYE